MTGPLLGAGNATLNKTLSLPQGPWHLLAILTSKQEIT